MRPRLHSRTWTRFGRRDRYLIEAQLLQGPESFCPRCGATLEARPGTRLSAVLPGAVSGFDLDCRDCRQFHPRLSHSPRSLYLLRLRRLAAAVSRS
jgi:ribosomal protein S27AE